MMDSYAMMSVQVLAIRVGLNRLRLLDDEKGLQAHQPSIVEYGCLGGGPVSFGKSYDTLRSPTPFKTPQHSRLNLNLNLLWLTRAM
jgi:hypothetical protein